MPSLARQLTFSNFRPQLFDFTSSSPPRWDRVSQLDINTKAGRDEIKQGEKLRWSFIKEVWLHDDQLSGDGMFVL